MLSFSATLILGFALASMYVKPNERDILSLFGLIFPYVYFFGLVVIPLAYKRHKITFLIGLALLIFGLKPLLSYVKPGLSSTNERSDIQVLTYNAMMGRRFVDKHHKVSEDRLTLLSDLMLQDPYPDVICIQEANQLVRDAYLAELTDYKYVHHASMRAAMIISKYPIIDKGQVDFGQKVNSCLWADVLVKDDTVRIYSLHLESNRLSESSYGFLAKESYEPIEAISGIKDLIVKYPLYAGKRAHQAERVKEHMNHSPYPIIVCGDFNDPPMSYTYKTIKKDLNDTFLDNGSGFGTTWIGAIPMLRIDYIFASDELDNIGFFCLESDLSDHYPVKASFKINE